jgi:hypothetical protein
MIPAPTLLLDNLLGRKKAKKILRDAETVSSAISKQYNSKQYNSSKRLLFIGNKQSKLLYSTESL